MSMLNIDKVLIANRGEIACRIARTLREMGIATVAVFSDADADALHVRAAEEAVRLGPAPSAASYLDVDAVIEAAQVTGAQAIHPGYGFLAENAAFAERCADAGLIFIGPTPEAIRRMGDKATAKATATSAGVPVIEGFAVEHGAEGLNVGLDVEAVHAAIKNIGYPVLIKAVAGGGGKGMRLVTGRDELDVALATARREAVSAFGDGALMVERHVSLARHIEVQILGDALGNMVHLFERDCSVQRRHQKVFEEAPAPDVDPALGARLGAAAVAVAQAVSYRGAGTVEFLIDQTGAFYFLEMNTRLQVEHPVTEMVTGLDLVRLQVEIAQGRALPFAQEDLTCAGHAIEARLYAEDATNDFLPATGTVALWSPPDLPGVRIDAGVARGDVVGVHYDPLLAKVIAHGATRDEARRRLGRALSAWAVGGVTTNRALLLMVLDNEAFRHGAVDTGFLERLPVAEWMRPRDDEIVALHAIAATLFEIDQRRQARQPVPRGVPLGWRNNRWRPQAQAFLHDGEALRVDYVADDFDGRVDGRVDGRLFEMSVHRAGDDTANSDAVGDDDLGSDTMVATRHARLIDRTGDRLVVEVDGVRRRFYVARHATGHAVHGLGRGSELDTVPRFPARVAAADVGACAAPMTGLVVQVLVAEGDSVVAGDPMVVLEAMKMEHRLAASTDGVVTRVNVAVGQMVDPDTPLVVVTAAED